MACLIPRPLQKDVHVAEVNWAPLSVVRVSGTPKRATQVERKASTQEAEEIPFRGVASSQREVRSIIVIIYTYPSADTGNGPTRSTCTWLNLLLGMAMGWTGAFG
jgi:hypothetical protein